MNRIISLVFILLFSLTCFCQQSLKLRIIEPGSLQKNLTEKQLKTIGELIISGNIDKTDFRFIAKSIRENPNIKSLDLTKTHLNEVGMQLFKDCNNLEFVKLPNSITAIGKEAFDGCSSLKNIRLPKDMTSIGGGAFRNCQSLDNIAIGKNLCWIGENAFEGCTSLKHIKLNKRNSYFKLDKQGHILSNNIIIF